MSEGRDPQLGAAPIGADAEKNWRDSRGVSAGSSRTSVSSGGDTEYEADDPAYQRAPGLPESIAIASVSMLLTALVVSVLGGYWERAATFGDGGAYREIATSIVRWDFAGLTAKYTWGYPYLGAALAILTPLPILHALVVVSWIASLFAVGLAQRLWGGWVAAYFAITSIDWIQHSVFGGSDTAATALTFGAFFTARRNRWSLAAFLAALAASVRPQAAFALIAIGLVLLGRKQFRALIACVAVGAAVLVLYLIPVWLAFGDPFANYHMYQSVDFPTSLLTFPFRATVDAFLAPYPWSPKVIATFWVLLVLAGVFAMVRSPRCRTYTYRFPVETVYVGLTVAFYFTYNSPFGFHSFSRYTLSILPLMYFAVMPWLPRHRGLLWSGAFLMPLVVGASAMNVRRTIGILQRALTR